MAAAESSTKLCTKCKCIKPITAFYVRGKKKSGDITYDSHCKSCRRRNRKPLSAEKRCSASFIAKRRALDKLERERHPEKVAAKNKKHYWNNRDYHLAKGKAWKQTHPEQVRASARKRRRNHPEAVLTVNRNWRAKNPDRVLAQHQRRRARVCEAPINDFSAEEWQFILEKYGHRCAYCGKKSKKLEADHILALSKGGTHAMDNIAPACRSCNARKHTGPPLVPVQHMLKLGF